MPCLATIALPTPSTRRCLTGLANWLIQNEFGLGLTDLAKPTPTPKETDMKTKQNPRDEQEPQTGKVANDHNKVGEQPLTQKNEAKRTPDSRTDREAHIGSGNQTQSRRGATGR